MCIVDGLKMSSSQSVKSGVSQGSVLGPVLFVIFINAMPLHLQTDIDMYADNTITHTAGKTVVEPKLQITAGDFNAWCIDNNMGVHYGKTHSFVVGSKHMTSANESISITINRHSTESVNTHKHLGITTDKQLTWEQQIDWYVKTLVVNSHVWSYYQNSLKQKARSTMALPI